MKKRIAKFLVSMGLIIPCLSGCNFFAADGDQSAGDNQSDVVDNNQSGDQSQNGQSGGNGNNGGNGGGFFNGDTNVPVYTGDSTRTVGTIPNTPTDHYSEQTLAKITKMIRSFSLSTNTSIRDRIARYMIELEIGEEVANALCDTVISFVGQIPKSSFNSRDSVNTWYNALKVLNSIDATKVSKLMRKINEEYEESEKGYYNTSYQAETILEYYNPDIGSLSYKQFKEFKENKDNFKSEQLNAILDEYESVFNNYYFSPDYVAHFEEYKAGLLEDDNEYYVYVFPEEVISFVEEHANDAKAILVSDLKLIIDAFASSAYDFVDIFGESTNELSFETADGHSYYLSDNNYTDRINQFFDLLFKNKNTTIGLINAILTDTRVANLLLDFVLDFLVPQAEARFAEEAETLAEIRQFKTRVSALSGAHVVALVSFAMKLFNQISQDDLAAVYLERYDYEERSEEESFDWFALGDKYDNILDNVIASLTAKEKSLIIETSQIFGFDLISELQNASRIYKGKDTSTEEGLEKLHDDMWEWAEPLLTKLYRPFHFLFSSPDNYGYNNGSSYKNPRRMDITEHISFYFYNSHFYLNDTSSAIQNRLYFDVYYEEEYENGDSRGYYCFDSSFGELSYYIQSYAEMIDRYGEEEFISNYGRGRYLAIQELRNITFSDIQVSLDTSKYGYLPLSISFKANGKVFSTSYDVEVSAYDLPYLYTGNFEESGTNYYTNNSSYSLYRKVFKQGANVTVYNRYSYYDETSTTTLDTSTTGWHYYFQQESSGNNYYLIYLVVDSSMLANYVSYTYSRIGYAVEGANGFYSSPELDVYYEYEGMEIYTYMYLKAQDSYFENKSANQIYKVNYGGFEFEYAIISRNSAAYTQYDFILDQPLSSTNITTPTQVQARVYKTCVYEVVIDGCLFIIGGDHSEETANATLTNFTLVDGVASFTYANKNYTFKYNY